jgi:hypothetical protein
MKFGTIATFIIRAARPYIKQILEEAAKKTDTPADDVFYKIVIDLLYSV